MQVIRKSRMGLRAAAALLLLVLTDLPASAQDDVPVQAIREILEAGAPPVTDIDAALGSAALADLRKVYTARAARPIWLGTDAGRSLLDRLSQPDVVVGPQLQPLLADARKRLDASDAPTRAGADLLLTALYGATAKALRPDGPAGFAEALAELDTATDLTALLREPEPPQVEAPPLAAPTVETPAPAPGGPPETPQTPKVVLDNPGLESPEAARFRAAFASLQGDWPFVPDGPKLEVGDAGSRVEALSRRLIASGDLKAGMPSTTFDLPLKSAMQRFQLRHGLPADGVAGAATLAALNIPAKERLQSLTRNVGRSKGRNWGERYLLVNIPAATYRLVEGGRTRAEGPVILGASATPTPIIDGVIDRVLLHPAYRIPQSVADRQLWPRQEEDALYFTSHGIRVSDDGLRQVPGPSNPLGPVKLLIAGNDRIALHGTPNATAAFESPERFTSLGCIALAEIAPLAKGLLAADPAWPEGRIDGALAVGGTETVALAQPLPLHVVYDTAWVDEDGTLEFRDDIYGWDRQTPAGDPNTVAEPCGS